MPAQATGFWTVLGLATVNRNGSGGDSNEWAPFGFGFFSCHLGGFLSSVAGLSRLPRLM